MRSTFRPEVVGDVGGFGGLFAPDWKRYDDPLLVSSTDGVGTKSLIARLAEPPRHDRHRLRRDVGRRHRRPGRRTAVLPRLHLGRPARPRGDRRARRRCRRGLSPRALRAARRRDVGASRTDGAGRVRSRRLRGRRRRPGEGAAAATCAPATASSASRARVCAATATRSRAPRCSSAAAARSTAPRGRRAPRPRRRAVAPERDLCTRDVAHGSRSGRARVRARHRRRHPRQPRAGAPRPMRRRRVEGFVGRATNLSRDPTRRRRRRTGDGARVQPRSRHARGGAAGRRVDAVDVARAAGHDAWLVGEIVDGHGRVQMVPAG